jgi:hyperpolarization activated cyclic nucleotide-gated potassium channel 1
MDVKDIPSYLLNPKGKIKRFWDIVMMTLLFYLGSYSPYRVAFVDEETPFLKVLELIVDILFIMDIVITFFTPYERFNGDYEVRIKRIAVNYLAGGFLIDFMASLPTQVFEKKDEGGAGSTKLLRLARLQRLYRLVRIFRVIKLVKATKYNEQLFVILKIFDFKQSHTRIIKVLMLSLFLVHLFGCFFYLQAKLQDFSTDTWVNKRGEIDKRTIQKYFSSIYWAFQTLTTVGYGDFGSSNTAEIFLTCIWMTIGVIFYSVVVGSMTILVIETNSKTESLKGKL